MPLKFGSRSEGASVNLWWEYPANFVSLTKLI
jgi:hypothetical protein